MATEESERSPYSRPGFLVAALVVAIVAVLGIVLAVSGVLRNEPGAAATASTSPPASSPASPPSSAAAPSPTPSSGASVCGLSGEVLAGKLNSAPAAEWEFQGTTGYPTSTAAGPGDTNAEGVRYCFQHSPEGAVFAAANAVAQGTDPEHAEPWLNYFLADGPNRAAVLAQGIGSGGSGGARVEIAGFRLLAYDGETARVDVAVRGSAGNGQTVNLSMVYDLVWEAGDWNLVVTNPAAPINVAQIPNVSGYIAWEE